MVWNILVWSTLTGPEATGVVDLDRFCNLFRHFTPDFTCSWLEPIGPSKTVTRSSTSASCRGCVASRKVPQESMTHSLTGELGTTIFQCILCFSLTYLSQCCWIPTHRKEPQEGSHWGSPFLVKFFWGKIQSVECENFLVEFCHCNRDNTRMTRWYAIFFCTHDCKYLNRGSDWKSVTFAEKTIKKFQHLNSIIEWGPLQDSMQFNRLQFFLFLFLSLLHPWLQTLE